ncbi:MULTISPECIES: hypothetical protein [Flavobacteriaceae]|jgi:hypothetical protein|uniref:Uncharacterized protein n=1 Tax=Arenibacter algicola TaxID=616991 RepID=A0A221UWR1_9FLAO|nr:hypothetical protein [Arenibacter algicola]ASO05784.1 hypothetical protein AREALGSMS7_02336 [Arenibacter algicola]|tara:strand:- start:7304 stop:7954 length:651 start_codon:yes stop_codon:yes gene_type:complete
MKRTIYILTVLLVSLSVRAQKEMLIGQLVNRSVVRENFDKNGVFLNKQTFKSGMLKELNGYYEIEVLTELFDENKKLNDTYTTNYRCRPEESSIMVMAFPFSNPKAKETEINTNSKNFKELYDLDNLEDIELEMSFDSGLLDFFGSKSKIKIYDRIVEPNGNSRNIKSKINIKAYAIGIRFKQLDYVVNETLNDKGLLSSQKFTEKDGSYFTMTYK